MKLCGIQHLVILCGAALLLYVLFYEILQVRENMHQPYYWAPDADSYLNASSNLFTFGIMDEVRPFGFPLLIGLPSIVGFEENSKQFAHFVNIGFWLASICMVYLIVAALSKNKKTAFWGAFLFIVIIGYPAICHQVLTEPACGFFMLLAGYHLAEFFNRKKSRHLAIFTISLGIGALVKPILYPVCCLSIVSLLLYFILRKEWYNMMLSHLPLPFFFIQIIGNGQLCGTYSFSNISGYTYYNYLSAYAAVSTSSLDLVYVLKSKRGFLKN